MQHAEQSVDNQHRRRRVESVIVDREVLQRAWVARSEPPNVECCSRHTHAHTHNAQCTAPPWHGTARKHIHLRRQRGMDAHPRTRTHFSAFARTHPALRDTSMHALSGRGQRAARSHHSPRSTPSPPPCTSMHCGHACAHVGVRMCTHACKRAHTCVHVHPQECKQACTRMRGWIAWR